MDLAEEVERIKWWHTIDLGNGIVTPGLDDSPKKLQRLGMPENLRGMSVLDVGAWDGFFSFEAERRGAARVVALDSAVHSVSDDGIDLPVASESAFMNW